MAVQLKPVEQQTIVITGASSGIGLCTARMAAARGARLVLASRNEEALSKLVDEITWAGGEAIFVKADVGLESDVEAIAEAARQRFGTFDTWVNNAAGSIYGKLEDVPVEDFRRLFETNFWGVVYGSLTAARYLKRLGGALINVGSTLSDRAIPLQGMYCASKHAVKGFTDALRMELEADDAPISVTLVKPAAIDTPYIEHAPNYLDTEPLNPPPVYAPDTVAETILYCAENQVRDVFVGGAAKAHSMLGKYAPRLADLLMEKTYLGQTRTGEPPKPKPLINLYEPRDARLHERGTYDGHVAESSIYTQASLHPGITGAIATGAALALGAGIAYSLIKRNRTD
ncbi:MAG: SDR family oxidoreductase [Pyrinomonadaceae bacterium]